MVSLLRQGSTSRWVRRAKETYHNHPHPHSGHLVRTITRESGSKPTEGERWCALTATSPSVLVTFRQFLGPPAILHALAMAFGRMYISKSAWRCWSSMTNASPAIKPINPKDDFEIKISAVHRGKESVLRRTSYSQCLKHSKPVIREHHPRSRKGIALTLITVNQHGNKQRAPGCFPSGPQQCS